MSKRSNDVSAETQPRQQDETHTQAATLSEWTERAMFTPHGTFSPVQLIGPLTLLVVCVAFWAWMFRDMLSNDRLTSSERDTWTWLFILLNVIGAAVYYANVYRGRR